MSIKKLLHPLILKGKQIYPLTSADQIIRADGSRLEVNDKINADTLQGFEPNYFLENAKGSVSIDLNNAQSSEQGVLINADALGGVLAEEYTTKEDVPFKFGIDENGNYGYIKDGADTVIPFKRDMKNLKIQFNASSISNLTIGNTYFIAMGNFQSTKNTGTVSAGAEVLYQSEWVNSGSAYNNYYYIGRFYIVKATASTITFANMNTGWSHVIYFDMNGLIFDNITYI